MLALKGYTFLDGIVHIANLAVGNLLCDAVLEDCILVGYELLLYSGQSLFPCCLLEHSESHLCLEPIAYDELVGVKCSLLQGVIVMSEAAEAIGEGSVMLSQDIYLFHFYLNLN